MLAKAKIRIIDDIAYLTVLSGGRVVCVSSVHVRLWHELLLRAEWEVHVFRQVAAGGLV